MSIISQHHKNTGHSITISCCEDVHLSSMLALYNAAFEQKWTVDQMSIYTSGESTHHKAWGAFCEKQLLGFVAILDVEHDLEIVTLCVEAQHRRRGIAKKILHSVLDHECHSCTLEVNAHNHAAQNLYQHLGFIKRGEREAYYKRGDNHFDDAFIYQYSKK